MGPEKKYCVVLSWLFLMYIIGALLFTSGFLLKRQTVQQNSSCNVPFSSEYDQHGDKGCWTHSRFQKAVILVIDALRFDFVAYNQSKQSSDCLHYQNKIKIVDEILRTKPQNGLLYHFQADPPTTTLQRLKGLTTGSLPTFVDVGSNFASSNIMEDNIVDQLKQIGKPMVFMGDDTWQDLFPERFVRSFPFPSFNVKDLHTVDNGVLDNLIPQIKTSDADIVIGHFLGVDHCGHTYGPNHVAMEDKLMQMDAVIRNVIKELSSDTILFVLGDHGMTKTGDHGGDSPDELDAALFVYSPSKITSGAQKKDTYDTISQIDFVPTVSLLLGAPIPFSNLGSIIKDLFNFCPWWKTEGSLTKQVYHTVKALRLNAHQVSNYLEAYRAISDEFPQEQYRELQQLFKEAEAELQAVVTDLHHNGNERGLTAKFQAVEAKLDKYLDGVKSMCQSIWAKFDIKSMMLGGGLVCTALIVNFILCLSATKGQHSSAALYSVLFASVIVTLINISIALSNMKLAPSMIAMMTSYSVVFIFSFVAYKIITTDPEAKTDTNPKLSMQNIDSLNIWAGVCCIAHGLGFFSNSFTVYEDTVASYLVQTMLWLHIFYAFRQLYRHKLKAQLMKGKFGTVLPKTKFDIGKVFTSRQFILFAIVVLFCTCIRLAQYFTTCREEQWTCEPSQFMTSLSGLMDNSSAYKNYRYFFATLSFVTIPVLCKKLLLRYGNLNEYSSFTVIYMRYLQPISIVCVCFYWALQALPQKLLNNLPDWQAVFLPRIAYAFSGSAIIAQIISPLCVYLKPKETDDQRLPVVGKEYETVVPKVFDHMKLNWRKHFSPNSENEVSQRETPIVYGLATVYSASVIAVAVAVYVYLALLLEDGVAPSLTLYSLCICAVLEICSSYYRLCPTSTETRYQVPLSSVATWSLLVSHFFYATGHQATVPAIRFQAAFVGFKGDHTIYAIPAAMITLNTFASHVLGAICLPLLVFWPFVHGRVMNTFEKNVEEDGESRKGEFVLNEDYSGMRAALYKLILTYSVVCGFKLLMALSAAAMHRRHLMVWKIFAPRFIYEGASFILTCVLLLCIYLFVLRIDQALNKWMKKLEGKSTN